MSLSIYSNLLKVKLYMFGNFIEKLQAVINFVFFFFFGVELFEVNF